MHNVKLSADYGAIEALEGEYIAGPVILGFREMDAAKAWYQALNFRLEQPKCSFPVSWLMACRVEMIDA